MTFEIINQNNPDQLANREKYSHPEDELDTPENIAVLKRERAFSAEGGFVKLLKLKVIIEEITSKSGFLNPSNNKPNFIQEVIDDPRTYAYSALGFDILKKEISDEELKVAVENFSGHEMGVEMAGYIDRYLEDITRYETTHQSKALDILRYTLEDAKKSALALNWTRYGEQVAKAKYYLKGIEDLVELCCGSARESDQTKAVLAKN